MIPVNDFAKYKKTIEFGAFYLKFHARLNTRDQNIASPSQRANELRGSIFMVLIMFGKLVSSISEGNFGVLCFNEHIKEDNCQKKKKKKKKRANFRGAAPAPFMGKLHLGRCRRKIIT